MIVCQVELLVLIEKRLAASSIINFKPRKAQLPRLVLFEAASGFSILLIFWMKFKQLPATKYLRLGVLLCL